MKQVFQSFLAHKDLYAISASLGSAMGVIIDFLIDLNQKQLFGLSLSLWLVCLGVNIIDIHTGIKADTARKKREGDKFVFVSKKAWRAFEKVIIFTLLMWFIYSMEREVVRLNLWSGYSSTLLVTKLVLLVYVVLIELQSIGENEQVRFGTKSKLFTMLDKIIDIVNDGLLTRLQSYLKK